MLFGLVDAGLVANLGLLVGTGVGGDGDGAQGRNCRWWVQL